MGLDVGDRRIGVALSDPGGILASPHSIIERVDDPRDIETILDIVRSRQVGAIVVGLPRTREGTVGHQAGKVIAFVERLKERADVPVAFRDEQLSTVTAQRLLRESGRRRKRKASRRWFASGCRWKGRPGTMMSYMETLSLSIIPLTTLSY